jgi:hypothetical protein
MTLPRSAADVLADHVLFEIEAIDRMYLNLYQPRLQHGAGVAAFFVGHRGHRFASSALMAPMTAAFVADIGHFAAARGLDLVRFAKGQRKDDVTREYLRQAERDGRGLIPAQVLYVGVAQEKQRVFRTSKRRNPVTGPPTRGSCRLRRWSTSTTSTAWMRSSGRMPTVWLCRAGRFCPG